MKKHIFHIVLASGLFSQTACSSASDETNSCYSDKLSDKGKVFTNGLNKPHFKGGHDSLVGYLSANIDLEKFIDDLSQNEKTYSDTAKIRFIVNKQGGISNLSVERAKKKKFADEITSVIKNSSCNWIAGGTEPPVNCWHQFDLYYSIDKPSGNEVKTVITINEL